MNLDFNLFWFFVIVGVILISYFVKECFFKTKDSDITNNIIDKYPLVNPLFFDKSIREQNAENNQEIHEINKRFDRQELEITELKETLNRAIEIIQELQKHE